MKGRGDFKSQLISRQKPRKRRTKASRPRYRVDLIDLHRNIAAAKRRRRPARPMWVRGALGSLFVLIAASSFFLLGYLIAPLPIPIWAKILLLTSIGTLGFVLSYFVVALFH